MDFGLKEFGVPGYKERLSRYREFLYETGAVDRGKGGLLDPAVVEKEKGKDFELTRAQRFKYRARYFTDSGIIGGKAFVSDTYRKVKDVYGSKREKLPKPVAGLAGVYSLKRLTE